MNRISNGPVAVETLAARLGLDADASLHFFGIEAGGNYAVAGANAVGFEPENLQTQLNAFLANNLFTARADALYVVFIGGNDLRGARGETDPLEARAIVRATAASVRATVQALAQAGARKFLLVNAPDISVIPETTIIADLPGDAGIFERAHRGSRQYCREIRRVAESFDDDDEIEVVVFDLFKFFARLLRKADKFGFSNTTEPCFLTLIRAPSPDCNFDEFIFFDEIHPSARVHAIVGEAMYERVVDEFDLDDDDEDDDEEDDDEDEDDDDE